MLSSPGSEVPSDSHNLPLQGEASLVRECLVYYNGNTQTLTNLWDTAANGESFPMKEPLLSDSKDSNLFSEGVIRNNDIIFKNDRAIVEICDLVGGHVKKKIPAVRLVNSSHFALENGRVYVHDGRRILEVTPLDEMEVVATSVVEIESFCVVRHDESQFRCVLLAPESSIHFVVRDESNSLKDVSTHKIPGAFEIFGQYRGKAFLRTMNPETFYNDDSLSVINEDGEEDIILLDSMCLGAAVLGDKIFAKHGNYVNVIDANRSTVIRKTTPCLESNCYLIKRCFV